MGTSVAMRHVFRHRMDICAAPTMRLRCGNRLLVQCCRNHMTDDGCCCRTFNDGQMLIRQRQEPLESATGIAEYARPVQGCGRHSPNELIELGRSSTWPELLRSLDASTVRFKFCVRHTTPGHPVRHLNCDSGCECCAPAQGRCAWDSAAGQPMPLATVSPTAIAPRQRCSHLRREMITGRSQCGSSAGPFLAMG